MNEETKYDINNPKSMLSPFEQMTIVMDKMFNNSKFHGISIQELWDQVNKIKAAMSLNKTKDGVNINDEYPTSKPNYANQYKDNLKQDPKDESKDKIINIDSTLISTSSIDNQAKLTDIINDQIKRIDKIESRLNYVSVRAEDKYDLYDQDIHKLMKSRIDDWENMCKNLETRLNDALEQLKEKDYNFREDFKNKINEVEVSIRTIKRNIMIINQPRVATDVASSAIK